MKNEKVLILLLAYIIGFNTAFIAFGMSSIGKNNYEGMSRASVNASASESDFSRGQTASAVTAYVTDEGLFAEVDDEERIISALVSDLDEPTDGFSYAVPLAVVSPNERFVHYCEQSVEVPTKCRHFVYVAAEHTVYRVTYQDQQIVSDVAVVGSSWNKSGLLSLDGHTSVSAAQPWLLQ